MNPYSKLGYLALVVETTAGTPVKPTTYVELMSESIVANYVVQPVTPISGKRDVNLRIAKDKVEVSGDITVLVEPKNLGYFLKNFGGAPSTSTIVASKVYEHVWSLSNTSEKTYTFDVKPADATYVMRYTGVKISQMAFSQSDNKVQVVISIVAQKAFTNARVTSALGNGTALEIDQTSGITTNDIVRVIDKSTLQTTDTASITTVDSETGITLAGAMTASVNDIIVIDKSTPIYTQSSELTWIGGAKFKMKAKNDSGNPIDNTSVRECEDFQINLLNELEPRYTAEGCNLANRFPTTIKVKGFTANGNIKNVFTTSDRIDDMRSNEHVALRFDFCGVAIDTNSAVAAALPLDTGSGNVLITASTAGDDGNDINVRVVTASDDTLVASKTGNNILVQLADTTGSKNTPTLVAAAINALSDVTSANEGGGDVSISDKANLTGGRNANQKELLRVDFPEVYFQPFNDNIEEENLIEEDINFDAYYDETDSRTTRILLRNGISSY